MILDMDSITTWLKQNYDLVSLAVGMLGVLVGVISVIYELKRRNNKKR
jgi:uncharacterized membrane protein HdeD (DUF308 family)